MFSVAFKWSAAGTQPTASGTHVTTLEHEVGDDTVEARAGVAEALLASAESTEVGGGLGDDVAVWVSTWTLDRLD